MSTQKNSLSARSGLASSSTNLENMKKIMNLLSAWVKLSEFMKTQKQKMNMDN